MHQGKKKYYQIPDQNDLKSTQFKGFNTPSFKNKNKTWELWILSNRWKFSKIDFLLKIIQEERGKNLNSPNIFLLKYKNNT